MNGVAWRGVITGDSDMIRDYVIATAGLLVIDGIIIIFFSLP